MGSKTYDFLTESLLFDEDGIAEEFASFSEEDLVNELGRYRTFCLGESSNLEAELRGGESNLVVLADEPLNVSCLTQAALYIDQYVFDDPLLLLKEKPLGMTKAMNQYLGMGSDERLNRKKLASTARTMKSLTPMVAGDFLKFLPLSAQKAPDDDLKINYSPSAYEDALPTEVLRLFKEAAVVKSMRKVEGGFVVEQKMFPSRAINITFKHHSGTRDFMYMLWDQHIQDMNEETRTFTASLTLPDEAPTPERFRHWVKQSVNQASLALFTGAEEKLETGARLNAVVGTQSDLLFRAIRKVFKPQSTVPLNTVNAFLNLDLPVLSRIEPEQLMKLRQQDGDSFRRFRLLLDQKLSGLRESTDPEETKRQAAIAIHELTEVRIDEIDTKMKGVKEKFATNAVIATLGLAAAVQTGGVSLLSTAAAAASIGKTYFDYRQDVKRNPAFFLWKLMNKRK